MNEKPTEQWPPPVIGMSKEQMQSELDKATHYRDCLLAALSAINPPADPGVRAYPEGESHDRNRTDATALVSRQLGTPASLAPLEIAKMTPNPDPKPHNPTCELCAGTGYYGDNGPGIKGNSEYQACECGTWSDGTRDWTEDFEHENGRYLCMCLSCGVSFSGHKRRVQCRACAQLRAARGLEPETFCPVCRKPEPCGCGATQAAQRHPDSRPASVEESLVSKPSFHADPIEQLAFELAFELEEAELSPDDLVSINRDKLRAISKRVYQRALDAARAESSAALADMTNQCKIAREVRHNRDELFMGRLRKLVPENKELKAKLASTEARLLEAERKAHALKEQLKLKLEGTIQACRRAQNALTLAENRWHEAEREAEAAQREAAESQAVAQRMREALIKTRGRCRLGYDDSLIEEASDALAVAPSAALMEFAEKAFREGHQSCDDSIPPKNAEDEAWQQSATRKSLSRAGGDGV